MKILIGIFIAITLSSCGGWIDPNTGRDPFGKVLMGTVTKPEKIGENKYYVEAWSRNDAIQGAKKGCSEMGGSTFDVISVDAPEGQYVMVTFTCK